MLALAAAVALIAADEESVRQIFASRCWACHSETALGGLRLDSREAMLRGGKSGASLVPGDAKSSRINQAITRQPGAKPMPPGPPLTAEEQGKITAWINAGAPWEGNGEHWSFRKLRTIEAGESIDKHLAALQKSKSITPNPRAGDSTLARRLAFDLTGLPPDEGATKDRAPGWYARLIDRLLASPHFGEKWGRHWLDVARYGEDDYSGTAVQPYANAWRYRDWVVESINRDLPYDQFLMAQIAGDRMNDPKLLPGTGLFGLGPWYYGISQPPQARADERNDRVDMVTRGMLGVTLACARCHDHKYDPLSIKDYYALAGVFASTAYKEYPLVPEAQVEAWKKQKNERDEAEKALNKFLDEQQAKLADRYALQIAPYMLGAKGLEPKVLARWKKYLEKPEESHPFLNLWHAGAKTPAEAEAFQKLILEISAEKKALDDENKKIVEAGKKLEAKPKHTVVLPGGYRSEEDFNPGAFIVSKSLERDRYVAWNRTFGEAGSPLKFPRKVTAQLLTGSARDEYKRLEQSFEGKKKALPPQYGFLAGSSEFDSIDLQLHLRGNPEELGEVIPRRFPLVLSGGKELPLRDGSGRLELANTVAHHPLASRVAVNRLWMILFGQGLVRTPSNFGKAGDRPAAPEVLEYLATRFAQGQYSVKTLVKEIVLSDAYQRASTASPANESTDASNRLVWRQSRRRLEAEPLRDAMLAVTGELDPTLGGESKPLDAKFTRRTLYAKTSRFQQDETLSLFDLPAAAVTCEQRVVTNVPLQKLFFLNSDVMAARALALSRRIEKRNASDGISQAYALLFARQPNAAERDAGLKFLAEAGKEKQAGKEKWRQYAQVLLSSNEFAYVD